jgi:hypothetical protein
MNGARSSRWLAWAGPLFTIGFGVIVFALQPSTPGEKASAQRVVNYYEAHQGRTLTSAFMGPLGAILLILFASYVASLARDRADGAGAGPTVLVAGAVVWASGLLLGSTVDLVLASAAHHHQGDIARTFNVLSNDSWIPFIAGIAITMVGAGMTVLRSRIVPVWLGWVALVAGVISLIGPGGFIGFFVAPLWLLVVGIMLGIAKEPAPAAA